MEQSILDTDTLSYVLANRFPDVSETAKQYKRVYGYFGITVITVCEIVEGLAANQNHEGIEAFSKSQETYVVFPLDADAAIIAGQILGALKRTGQGIGDLDPFIAAIAIVNQLPLVTNNQEHFQRIVELGFPLVLDNWRRI